MKKFKTGEKKMKNIIKIFLIVMVFSNLGYSGPRVKFGTLAAPELLIPVGSVGTSLQGSNLANITGIESMYWNPAGLSQINSKSGEAIFSHMNYVADINMQYAGGVVKLGNFGFIGASLRALNFGDELVTTELSPEGTGEIFNPLYLVVNLSFARAMTDNIHFGTNVKLINEKVADVSATGFAFDFGLQYIAGSSGLRFGIVLKNLGPSMRFDGPGLDRQFNEGGQTTIRRVNLQEFDLPTNLEMGLSYAFAFGRQNELSLSTAYQNAGFTSDQYRFGLEYNYNRIFYLRGSLVHYADFEQDDNLFGPSFGAGIKYPVSDMILGFDYAYRIVNETGFNSTNQFFTLNVGF
jgi:hypothetical protein